MNTVVDVAVLSPSLLVHEEEDVGRLRRGANFSLTPSSISLVQLRSLDRRTGFDCYRHERQPT